MVVNKIWGTCNKKKCNKQNIGNMIEGVQIQT